MHATNSFPEVALHFVQDPQTRFRLALACGNIEVRACFVCAARWVTNAWTTDDDNGALDGLPVTVAITTQPPNPHGAMRLRRTNQVAMATSQELGDEQCWAQLGSEALRQGNHAVRFACLRVDCEIKISAADAIA